MFDFSNFLGNIVDTSEVENVNFNPDGLTSTKKASKVSGHIMAEILLWGAYR